MSAMDILKGGAGGSAIFVRRPVLTIVLNLLIIVAGIAAFSGVEIRELPNIDQPVISVRTQYIGASPESVDKEVTSLIEDAVARVPGVTNISSQSGSGQSNVTIEFATKTDINVAAADVRNAVGNIRGLPNNTNFRTPTIVKADVASDAIMQLAATAPKSMTIERLTQIVNEQIANRLAAVDGVADVQMFGDRLPQIRVVFDPDALAARRLTIADLTNALSTVALDTPAGNIADSNRTLLVRADQSIKNPEDIAALPITVNGQGTGAASGATKVGDVADIVYAPADTVTGLKFNGQAAVGMGIVRQAKANTLDISNGVRKVVDSLNMTLPEGVRLHVTSDDAIFIGSSIEEVLMTLGLATSIVIAIIYIFLRSTKVTFIPAVTVPIALTGTVAAIWAMGFSINLLTLLALVLATGLVVDDAIVVIENIARQRSLGMGPRAAAVLGTKQVFFAVISTTATLVAVFVPISFFPGITGRLFAEFGFVLAFAVVLSCIVALTLSPMLASRLMGAESHEPSRNPIGRLLSFIGTGTINLYTRALDFSLKAPLVIITAALLFAGGAVYTFRLIPSELTPPEDRGSISVFANAPQGSTVSYTADQMRLVEQLVQPIFDSGEAIDIFSISGFGGGGGGGGNLTLTLADWSKRTRSQQQITADLARRFQTIPGIQVNARTANSLGVRGGGQGLTFAIAGSAYAGLADVSAKLITALDADPIFQNPRLNSDLTQPQLSIRVDRLRAAAAGVPLATITGVVQTLLAGTLNGNFYGAGAQAISIRTVAPTGLIQDPHALDYIQLRSTSGKMVPLSSLVTFAETGVAPNLPRQSQRPALPMTVGLSPGIDMGTAIDHLNTIAANTVRDSAQIIYTGEAKQLLQNSSGLLRTFAFAVLIVLLVLAAQFESFASAAILFSTVPFGLASAVFAIYLTGGTLNIYSQIGLVMLVGLMSKNGILIVEFANQLRDQGQSVREAIRNACLIRLRPVVMTMIATVLGGLPLLMSHGAGAEARAALGWIIVGGLGFATVFTLFLTPVSYSLLARFSKPRVHEEHRLTKELAEAEGTPHRQRPRLVPSGTPEDGVIPVAAE